MMCDAMMEATFYSITLDSGLHVDYLNPPFNTVFNLIASSPISATVSTLPCQLIFS